MVVGGKESHMERTSFKEKRRRSKADAAKIDAAEISIAAKIKISIASFFIVIIAIVSPFKKMLEILFWLATTVCMLNKNNAIQEIQDTGLN
jgi:hypothetical protein